MIGIDVALEKRLNTAASTASNPRVTSSERQAALNVFNSLVHFRNNFGVPPRVKSRKEVDEMVKNGVLKPGESLFIAPNGAIRRVPENYGGSE
jgi:hypothetical protein